MTSRRINTGTGRVSVTGHAPSVSVIANFAWQHLKAATIFCDRVAALEGENIGKPLGPYFEELRSYASACVMSSAASLEALINEFFIAPNCKLRSLLSDFDKDFWGEKGIERLPVLVKYQRALTMLGIPTLDEGASPYNDAWALIELRNSLVHYKPTWDPDRERKVTLVQALEGRFRLSPFVDENADLVSMRCMGAGCARWAVVTTLAFMRMFHDRANLDAQKMAGIWKLDTSS